MRIFYSYLVKFIRVELVTLHFKHAIPSNIFLPSFCIGLRIDNDSTECKYDASINIFRNNK